MARSQRDQPMTVVLTGRTLGIQDVVDVARSGADVTIAGEAVDRIRAARAVVEAADERGEDIYGLTTGLGAAQRHPLGAGKAAAMQWDHVRAHLVGQGLAFEPEIVRAAALVKANGLAAGRVGIRPEVVERLLDTLNAGRLPKVPSLGSVGQADLAPLAHLAMGALDGLDLQPGEALALLSGNAFATGHAALIVADCAGLLDAMDGAAAVALEGFRANLSPLDLSVLEARPFAGVRTTIDRLHAELDGSSLWDAGVARNLQDPLTFRDVTEVNGTARDAHGFALDRVARELNAEQHSPIVVPGKDRVVSIAAYDAQGLATALDVLRIGLVPAVLASSERSVKLLDASWSGLPRGLVADGVDGLAYLGVAVQGLAAEAKLLAAPVSMELASTAHAEGIEDRSALAGLAARRAAELLERSARVVAIELVVATQAIDAQPPRRLGAGVTRTHERVRSVAPRATVDRPFPPDLEPVVALVTAGVASVTA